MDSETRQAVLVRLEPASNEIVCIFPGKATDVWGGILYYSLFRGFRSCAIKSVMTLTRPVPLTPEVEELLAQVQLLIPEKLYLVESIGNDELDSYKLSLQKLRLASF